MKSSYSVACVASVSNRVIARKLEREQKRTRAETLSTQASYSETAHQGEGEYSAIKVLGMIEGFWGA